MSTEIIPSPASVILDASTEDTSLPYMGEIPFEQRDAAKALIADIVGIRVPKTWVPRGESLLPVGEEKLSGIRADFAKLPALATGLDGYRSRLTAESAIDMPVRIREVRMDAARGGLFGEGQDPGRSMAYSRAGFSHVSSFIKPTSVRNGFSENLLAMPVKMRSDWFNECARNARSEDDQVTVRTVMGLGEGGMRRMVRAVTSQRHSLETGDDGAIVHALRTLQGIKGAKVRITRHGLGEASWFEVLWPAVDRQIRVGDSLAFGIRFRNSETKAGALVVEPFLFDAICYNLTTAYSTLLDEGAFTLRHVGDLSKRLPSVVLQAQRTIEPFIKAFGDAYKTPFPTVLQTRGDVLQRVGKVLELPESTLTLAQQLWDADGAAGAGDTLAGLANAMTRAAQEQTMETADATMRAAGKVVAEGWGALERVTPAAKA